MRRLEEAKIQIAFLVLCIVVVGAFILYQTVSNFTGSTSFMFSASSDLPDPFAALKYGRVGTEDLHYLGVGESYDVVVDVVNERDRIVDYRLVVDSSVFRDERVFSLRSGDASSVKFTFMPTESMKWVYDHTEVNSTKQVFDLRDDSWLGVREVACEGVVFAPVAVDVGDFGDILHLNLSFQEIQRKHYRWEHSKTTSGLFNKKIVTGSTELTVKADKLHLRKSETTKVFTSKPQQFKLQLYIDNSPEPQTLTFWYQIK